MDGPDSRFAQNSYGNGARASKSRRSDWMRCQTDLDIVTATKIDAIQQHRTVRQRGKKRSLFRERPLTVMQHHDATATERQPTTAPFAISCTIDRATVTKEPSSRVDDH